MHGSRALRSRRDASARLARVGARAYAWGVQLGAHRALLFVMALSFVGCGREREAREWRPDDHQPPSAEAEAAQAGGAEPVTVERAAAALFAASCAGCHGVDGRGGGDSAPPGAVMPDLSAAAVQDRSDQDMATVIREGRGMMPGFGSQLNERGIAALVAHVRTLRAQ